MAKNKTTTKKKPSKSTVGGSALKTKKSLNWKIIIPIIVLIALVGGFQVFRSRAAAGRTFEKFAESMSYVPNTIPAAQYGTEKFNGITYKVLKNHRSQSFASSIQVPITAADIASSRQMCAHFQVLTPGNWTYNSFKVMQVQAPPYNEIRASAELSTIGNVSSTTKCFNTDKTAKPGFVQVQLGGGYDLKLGVDVIYGQL